jgi:hypothetical protein
MTLPFKDYPSHLFMSEALGRLPLNMTQLGDVLGVDPETVYRWARDPAKYHSARAMPETARRVIVWMIEPGRPKSWPLAEGEDQ